MIRLERRKSFKKRGWEKCLGSKLYGGALLSNLFCQSEEQGAGQGRRKRNVKGVGGH